jgi:hypothetical protein
MPTRRTPEAARPRQVEAMKRWWLARFTLEETPGCTESFLL